MRNFVITLVLGAVIGFGCAKAIDQSATASEAEVVDIAEDNMVIEPGTVLAIKYLAPKEGVDIAEFKKFLLEENYPAWQAAMPGTRPYLIEGDRGDKAGELAMLWVFKDEATRGNYWDSEDGSNLESFDKIMEELSELLEKETSYRSIVGGTDFIVQ